MTKNELLGNRVFQLMDGDAEIITETMGFHRVRAVRRGQTPRTGDRFALILSSK